MSDQFDLNKPCKDQGLTGDALMRCQEARNSARRNKIGAPKLDESGENKSKKIFGVESLEEQQAKIDEMGFLNWYSDYTGGGEMMKNITNSWKDTDKAIMPRKYLGEKFGYSRYNEKDTEIRNDLLGDLEEDFDAIAAEYKTYSGGMYVTGKKGTNKSELASKPIVGTKENIKNGLIPKGAKRSILTALDQEFLAIWKEEDGFSQEWGEGHATLPSKDEGEIYDSYVRALGKFNENRLEQQNQEITKRYGGSVLEAYKKSGRDVMNMDLNAFDKKTLDPL